MVPSRKLVLVCSHRDKSCRKHILYDSYCLAKIMQGGPCKSPHIWYVDLRGCQLIAAWCGRAVGCTASEKKCRKSVLNTLNTRMKYQNALCLCESAGSQFFKWRGFILGLSNDWNVDKSQIIAKKPHFFKDLFKLYSDTFLWNCQLWTS